MSSPLEFFSLFQERSSPLDLFSLSSKILKLLGLNVSFAVRNLIYQVIVVGHRLHLGLFKPVCSLSIVTIMVVAMLAAMVSATQASLNGTQAKLQSLILGHQILYLEFLIVASANNIATRTATKWYISNVVSQRMRWSARFPLKCYFVSIRIVILRCSIVKLTDVIRFIIIASIISLKDAWITGGLTIVTWSSPISTLERLFFVIQLFNAWVAILQLTICLVEGGICLSRDRAGETIERVRNELRS